jgi:cytidylate kinase
MYRVITYLALNGNLSLEDEESLTKLTSLTKIELVRNDDGKQVVYCNNSNITENIRSPLVNRNVSKVAMYPGVRKELVRIQQALAKNKNVVMDGRDIGTVVLPEAECKIFLTASLEERAKRRYLELKHKGYEASLSHIKEDVAQRDYMDENRTMSPLVPAEDAVIIDTTNLSPDKVIQQILKMHQIKKEDKKEDKK